MDFFYMDIPRLYIFSIIVLHLINTALALIGIDDSYKQYIDFFKKKRVAFSKIKEIKKENIELKNKIINEEITN